MKRLLFLSVLLTAAVLVLSSCSENACNHSYSAWTVLSNPTCAVCGVRTRSCTLCGEVQSEEIPKVTDHAFGAWETTAAASCKDEGTRARVCEICAKQETEKIGKSETHVYSAWETVTPATCKDKGEEKHVCSVCGAEESRETELLTTHSFSLWEEVTPATCKDEGLKTRDCSVCGKHEEKPVAKLTTHAFGQIAVTKEATFFKDGEGTHVCADCGLTETVAVPKTGTYVYLYEDFSDTPALISDDGANAMIHGIDYSTMGKKSKMLTETDGTNSYLLYSSTVSGTDTILNMSMKEIFGATSGKTLADLLVDDKLTFSFRLRCNYPDNEYAAFYLRLRGPGGTGDVTEFFRVKWDGKVLCNTLNLGTLTKEFHTYSVTLDFKEGKLYGYVDGDLKGSSDFAAPSGTFEKWLPGVDTYVFNGSFTPANGYDKYVYIDDIVFMGGGYANELCPKDE